MDIENIMVSRVGQMKSTRTVWFHSYVWYVWQKTTNEQIKQIMFKKLISTVNSMGLPAGKESGEVGGGKWGRIHGDRRIWDFGSGEHTVIISDLL